MILLFGLKQKVKSNYLWKKLDNIFFFCIMVDMNEINKESHRVADLGFDAELLVADQGMQINSTLKKLTEQTSINNGYTDDVRIELGKINETLILIAQILRNK